MVNSENNKATLENFLDNSTINFYRFVRDNGGGEWWDNGTALGVVSLGYGFFPDRGGLYVGNFGFRQSKNAILILDVGRMLLHDNQLYMYRQEGLRGHTIRYVKAPDNASNNKYINNIIEQLTESSDIPITSRMMPYLTNMIKDIKRAEFWTVRKYMLQSKYTSVPKSIHTKSSFKEIIETSFSATPEPDPVKFFLPE